MLHDLWLPINMPLIFNEWSVSVAESSAGEVARTGGEPHDWAGDASDPPKALVRPRSEGINQRRSTQLGDVSMLDDGLEFKKEIRTIFFSFLPPSGSVDPP